MTLPLQTATRFPGPGSLDRREWLGYASVFGSAFLAAQGLAEGGESTASAPKAEAAPRKYAMKKAINLWALPYPKAMTLSDCFRIVRDAGFEGVEVNFNLEGEISPEAPTDDLKRLGDSVRKLGLEISGLCSFLFWPYSLTSNDPERRKKGRQLAAQMVQAAAALGTKNLLVVPGAVYIPWAPEPEPVSNDVCRQRAQEAIREVLPEAERLGVSLNLENIFANGFLMSPQEMNAFVDEFQSPAVGVHFDTGNIMQFQFPQHWIELCGRRIRNVHLKEYSKQAGTEFTLNAFRPLLDGTTDWPAVLNAFERIGYDGWLTFEYFNPYPHWPEALVHQTSDSLDRMLGRKA